LVNKSDNFVVIVTINYAIYILLLWFIVFPKAKKNVYVSALFNPLNSELNPICHLLTLLGAHLLFHISRITVRGLFWKKRFILQLKLSHKAGRSWVCLRRSVMQCLHRRILRNTDNTRQNCSFRVSVSVTSVSLCPQFLFCRAYFLHP